MIPGLPSLGIAATVAAVVLGLLWRNEVLGQRAEQLEHELAVQETIVRQARAAAELAAAHAVRWQREAQERSAVARTIAKEGKHAPLDPDIARALDALRLQRAAD